MSVVYSIAMLIIFLVILPMIMGQIWRGTLKNGGVIFTYLSGFFTILAIFEVVGVPMAYLFVPLHVQVPIYSVIFIIVAGVILFMNRERIAPKKLFSSELVTKVKEYFATFTVYEWIYFVALLGLMGLQLYYAIFYDVGNFRSDDGTYVVFSSAAIHDDGFFLTDVVSGKYTKVFDYKYGLCAIYYFYTYVAVITGLGPAIIEQTVCAALFLLMAYGACLMLSKILFEKDEDRDNRMIFLILLSLVFIFGYHSTYSLSFRLLGPVWQGKAVLAVIVTPFLLAIFSWFQWEGITKERLLFCIVISLAAISLTLGGVIVLGVIPGILGVIELIRSKKVKNLLYLPAMWLLPVMVMMIYLIKK